MDVALMLCYFFPPIGGGGVQRSTKFAKYLPAHGWRPAIVAAKPNGRNVIENGRDESLLSDVLPGTEVVRTASVEFAGIFALLNRLRARKLIVNAERMIPLLPTNYKIGWYPSALRAARRIASTGNVGVIYSSSPPYSAHFVARALQRERSIPWVADFRDAWTQIATYRPPWQAHARLERRLEGGILRDADVVIANTPRNRQAMIDAFGISANKISVIPNGFDPADFETATPVPIDLSRFRVTCLGNFYEMPHADRFFRAFRRFADDQPEASLSLYGWQARGVRNAAESLLLPGTWHRSDRIDHNEAVRVMRASSVLLANLPNENARHWVPGKLYEYMAAGRPVLFIGPSDGDAAAVIREAGAGEVVCNDEDHIYNSLLRLYRAWQKGDWSPHGSALQRFDRRVQTALLARIFDTVAGRS
ncbi:MAG: glycosyltransferase [Anaerolineae bacterium]|nr:glycosyltransferase [Gemmatimonadaceae bacterium]